MTVQTHGAVGTDHAARTILLRSCWQSANIGDIAHAPGTIATWRRLLPDVEIILWPKQMDRHERSDIRRWFPDVTIVDGTIVDDRPDTVELAAAWARADLLVHGPAGGIVEQEAFGAWRRTGRPYGYYGVTIDPVDQLIGGTLPQLERMIQALPATSMEPGLRDLLSGAAFVLCRDSLSLDYLRRQQLTGPLVGYCPDATFNHTERQDEAAAQLLSRVGIDGPFSCVVPRLRHAPYHRLRRFAPAPRDLMKDAHNAAHREHDLRGLAHAVAGHLRLVGGQILLCPEMSHAVEVYGEIIAHLPADLRDRVATVDHYWTLGEATAIYARARTVISMECHSPILAIAQGVPAVYYRLPSETVKGRMYADLGVPELVYETTDAGAAERIAVDTAAMARTEHAVDTGRIVARSMAAHEQAIGAIRTALGLVDDELVPSDVEPAR